MLAGSQDRATAQLGQWQLHGYSESLLREEAMTREMWRSWVDASLHPQSRIHRNFGMKTLVFSYCIVG